MNLKKVRDLKLLVLEMGSIPQQDVIDLCEAFASLHATSVTLLNEACGYCALGRSEKCFRCRFYQLPELDIDLWKLNESNS